MELYRHIKSLRKTLSAVKARHEVLAFVPTMGNLHAGHLALVERAKLVSDFVVVSIFVNPLQFNLREDWDQYPRTLEADGQKLNEAACDLLFLPDEREIYPNGMADQTRVVVPSMTDRLCGASRPGHFEGVTTVVSKLFHIIQPDKAIFGLKDFQQIAVIRRMVSDLCMPITILSGDIVRESDGLAMSSRNHFITPEERPRANTLYLVLTNIAKSIESGRKDYSHLEKEAQEEIIAAGFRPDYLKICCYDTLSPAGVDDQKLIILGAMFTQAARLIDNVALKISR